MVLGVEYYIVLYPITILSLYLESHVMYRLTQSGKPGCRKSSLKSFLKSTPALVLFQPVQSIAVMLCNNKIQKIPKQNKAYKTNCFVLLIYIQICVKTFIMLCVHCAFCQLEARRLFGCCLKYLTEVEERPAASLPSESRETVGSPWLQLFLIPQSCSLLPAPQQ